MAPAAWSLGVASLLVWIPVLPLTQPEQRLRNEVENDLRGGRIHRALATMSAHDRGDFPPHWEPPPRIGYGERQPPILNVVETLLAMDAEPWVVDLFLDKLRGREGIQWRQAFEQPPTNEDRAESQRARLRALLQRRDGPDAAAE